MNDQRNGVGKLEFSNGESYEGEFKDGLKHGKGKKKYFKNTICEGRWDNDQFVGDKCTIF